MTEKQERNLIPLDKRTESEQRNITSKGGVASGKSRRRKRSMRQLAGLVMSLKPKLDAEQLIELEQMGIDTKNEDITCALISVISLVKKSMIGDLRAIELYLQLMCEDSQSVIAKDRLKFEKDKLNILAKTDELPIDQINSQILSLAALINHPLPKRDLPDRDLPD
jgi:hypothetical protein